MGRKTVARLEKEAAVEASFAHAFAAHNKQLKDQGIKSVTPISAYVMPHIEKAIRNMGDFKARTKTDNRDKQLLELVRFLFNKYPVSAFFNRVWDATDSTMLDPQYRNVTLNKKRDYRNWYVCIATGGSFYKEYAKDFFTKKEAHLFVSCPHLLDIEDVLVYAVAKAAGADEGHALRLARTKLNRKEFNDFWRGVIRFFSVNRTESIEQTNDLIDYISAKYVENRNFTLFGSGHTVNSLLIKTEEWHRALNRAKVLGDTQWEGHAVEDSVFERVDQLGNKVFWELKQIKSSKALAAEGTCMRHCVLSYKTYCVKGTTSIWQLLYIDATGTSHNKLTIELNNAGTIVQARGLANRAARNDELGVLKQWCAKEGFTIYNYM